MVVQIVSGEYLDPEDGTFSYWMGPAVVDAVIAALAKLYQGLPKPAPESVPPEALRPGLAEAFAKDIPDLTDSDLHNIIWGIKPGQYADLNALRYYLPAIARLYAQGARYIDGDALECGLLAWHDEFNAMERNILTQIALERWRNHVDRWDWEVPFLLLETLVRLRESVAHADNPLQLLWSNLYLGMEMELYARIVAARGGRILQFLHEVDWVH